ncbi:MAG TPA: SAF domain-containing protein [Pyrinomonadaceae bacterium]
MADISSLEGIHSDEVDALCRAKIRTTEEFEAQIEPPFFNYGIMYMSINTDIKPDRLIEFVPPELVPMDLLPDVWLEGLAARVLREPLPDGDPWRKRCRRGLQRFGRGLKGHWKGWKDNLQIFVLMAVLLLLLALALRAAGGLQGLPSPLGLRDRALITADSLESGRALKSGDLYPALLPPESDYFKPGDNLEGLILARKISSQTPLRFRDVLRHQVIATKDIQANAVLQKEDITLALTPYQPGAALKLEEVYGRISSQTVRKDAAVLSEFIKSAE